MSSVDFEEDANVLFDMGRQIAEIDLHEWFKKVNNDLAYTDWTRKSKFQGYEFETRFTKEVVNGKALYYAELVVLKDDDSNVYRHHQHAMKDCYLYVDKGINLDQVDNKPFYVCDYDDDGLRLTHLSFLAPAWEILKLEQESKLIMYLGYERSVKSYRLFSSEGTECAFKIMTGDVCSEC